MHTTRICPQDHQSQLELKHHGGAVMLPPHDIVEDFHTSRPEPPGCNLECQPTFVPCVEHVRRQHAIQPEQSLLSQTPAEGLLRTQDLVSRGCIEYVDCEEEETTMIAMEIKDLDRATDGHIAYSNTCAHRCHRLVITRAYTMMPADAAA